MRKELWDATLDFLWWLVSFVFVRPEDAKEHPINAEPAVPPTNPPAHALLCTTAKKYLGKDASPGDLVKSEVACAETVVHIVNETWPGTLNHSIVGTDVLFQALKRSPRFMGVLNPTPGCVEISPRTATTNGHAGIYVGPDEIASNDSRTGRFEINYTRQSWRNVFIKGRGLKAYLFQPVDL